MEGGLRESNKMIEIKFLLEMDNFSIAKSSKIPIIQTDWDLNYSLKM
jgi:hypothetical protein